MTDSKAAPAKRKVRTSKKVEAPIEFVYIPDANAPYGILPTEADKSALTTNAFGFSAAISVSKAGRVINSRKKLLPGLANRIMGKTAPAYWRKQGWLDADNVLTDAGRAVLDARLQGAAKKYNTTPKHVERVAKAMREGGIHDFDGTKVAFTVKVPVS